MKPLFFLCAYFAMCVTFSWQYGQDNYGGVRIKPSLMEQLLDLSEEIKNGNEDCQGEIDLTRLKRQAATRLMQPNKPYQECIAPGGKKGHCRHASYCLLDEIKRNVLNFMDYMCIIERSFIGICCPDGAENEVHGRNTRILVEDLPLIVEDTAELEEEDPLSIRPENRGCGLSGNVKLRNFRLFGAKPSTPKDWPWMAAVMVQDEEPLCGGVLITDRHVMTAAHCVYRLKKSHMKVRLGEYDVSRTNDTRSRDFRVVEVTPHEDFAPNTYEHDIAILKLHRPATFNSYIWPVCLPPLGMTFENLSAVVIGWGTQSYGGPSSDVLMEVNVPVWPRDKCVSAFVEAVQETMMCAAAYEGGKDACQGDSGGPLMYQLSNGRWISIGIVSWGILCGQPGLPGVYTRVNSYLPWIVENCRF